MSALTERVAREHQRIFNAKHGLGPHCTCGWVHPGYDGSQKHVQHVAEVTEQAVRASVAAEIRAERTQVLTGDVAGQFEAAALGLAARIAEGKRL